MTLETFFGKFDTFADAPDAVAARQVTFPLFDESEVNGPKRPPLHPLLAGWATLSR